MKQFETHFLKPQVLDAKFDANIFVVKLITLYKKTYKCKILQSFQSNLIKMTRKLYEIYYFIIFNTLKTKHARKTFVIRAMYLYETTVFDVGNMLIVNINHNCYTII